MDEAYFREKQVQGWSHAKKKALIEKNFQPYTRIGKE